MSRRAVILPHPGLAACGFYGKLPARGDFVRIGLPSYFITAWDDWAQVVLAGSRGIMGEDFVPAWLEAPVWHFALAAGLLGPDAAVGLFMPSVDRVGRYFPLCFACLEPALNASEAAQKRASWCEAAEAAGRAAIAEDLEPETVAERIARPATAAAAAPGLPPALFPPGSGLWWTEGAPRVSPIALALTAMPDPTRFAAMLDARFLPLGCGANG